MDDMVREGVASFKLFMAYPNVLMVDDATIFKALQQTAKNGALICMHAENGIGDRRDRAAGAGRGQDRAHLSRAHAAHAAPRRRPCIAPSPWRRWPACRCTSCISPARTRSNQVREARDRGLPAFAETCPQYLLLSLEDVADKGWEGAKYVFTPPLREKKNQPKLWEGLRKDNLQVVSTDHCPFCFADQKALGKDDFTKIPNGGPGIENRLQLLHHHGVGQGNFSLNRFVELVSTAPARIFGMYPKKGVLAAGQRRGHRALGPGGGAHDQRSHASHARRLLDVRRLQGARQCARGVLARRVDCRRRQVHRQAGPRPVSAPRGARRRVEIDAAFLMIDLVRLDR